MGAQKGQVLAMFLPNCMEFPIVFGGATNAGLPVTTMNPIYKSTEIARQLKMSKAKWAVTNKELLPVMQEAISKLDEPKENWKDRVIIVENEPSKYSRFIFKSKFSPKFSFVRSKGPYSINFNSSESTIKTKFSIQNLILCLLCPHLRSHLSP